MHKGWAASMLVLVFSASGTNAQSTDCMVMANLIHCNRLPDSSRSQGKYDYQGQEVLGRAVGNLVFGNRELSFRKKVGAMLADGDCQGAARYALQKGRLELSTAIARSCASKGR